jgi:hypothetical protein
LGGEGENGRRGEREMERETGLTLENGREAVLPESHQFAIQGILLSSQLIQRRPAQLSTSGDSSGIQTRPDPTMQIDPSSYSQNFDPHWPGYITELRTGLLTHHSSFILHPLSFLS